MNQTLKLVSGAIVVGIAAALWGRLDPFHLIGAGVLSAVLLLAVLFWRRQRRPIEDDVPRPEPLPASPLRSILLGSVGGVFCVVYLAAGLAVLRQAPWLYPAYYSADRREVLRTVNTLEAAGNHRQAAVLIRQRLEKPLGEQFRSELARRLYRCLVEAGKQTAELAQRQTLLQQADDAAREFGLDNTLARALFDQAAREQQLAQTVESLRAQQRWPELVEVLKAAILQYPERAWAFPLDRRLHDAYVSWGDHAVRLQDQKQKYEAAVQIARQYGLDESEATSKLKLLEAKAAALAELENERRQRAAERDRAVELPAGTQVGFAEVSLERYPPVILAEVFVEVNGLPIAGLERKDFTVSVAGRPAECLLAAVQKDPPPLNVALVIDCSGSMAGKPLAAARQGAQVFLAGLEGSKAQVTIVAFQDHVQQLVRPTGDLRQAALPLEALQADGSTALWAAAERAVQTLGQQPGERRLVVFTDGQDTVGGTSPEEVVRRCQQARVVVDAIGLRSSDLDAAPLEHMAEQSGGRYLEADGPEDLVPIYRALARRVSRSLYRLVITPSADTAVQEAVALEIYVGNNRLAVSRTIMPGGMARR